MTFTVAYETYKNGQPTRVLCGAIFLRKSGRGYRATFGEALLSMYPMNTKTGKDLVKAAKYLANEGANSTVLEPTKFGVTLQVNRVVSRS